MVCLKGLGLVLYPVGRLDALLRRHFCDHSVYHAEHVFAGGYRGHPDVDRNLAFLRRDVVTRSSGYLCQAAADRLGLVLRRADALDLCLDRLPEIVHLLYRVLGKPRRACVRAVANVAREPDRKPALVRYGDIFNARRLAKDRIVDTELALDQLLYPGRVALFVYNAGENDRAALLWKLGRSQEHRYERSLCV